MLGAIAANLLPGDPVWLGLIAPPGSSAKTELLSFISGLPHVVQAATVTPSGLLSGTPDKQKDKGARGGLLRQIDGFGGFGASPHYERPISSRSGELVTTSPPFPPTQRGRQGPDSRSPQHQRSAANDCLAAAKLVRVFHLQCPKRSLGPAFGALRCHLNSIITA